MSKLKPTECEFAIYTNGGTKDARVSITGNYPQYKYFRKLETLSTKYPAVYKLISEDVDEDGNVNHRTYTCPAKYACGLRAPSSRVLNPEIHAKMVERGKMLAEMRKEQKN